MQLMCDILVHDSKSSACLNDEQKSLLAAFEQRGANVTTQRSSKRYASSGSHGLHCGKAPTASSVWTHLVPLCSVRLSVIDESSYLSVCHSDISYDRTDDDVVRSWELPRRGKCSTFMLHLLHGCWSEGRGLSQLPGATGGATLDEWLGMLTERSATWQTRRW